ncbi:MAG: phosphatidate cytidylyltransferase [Verrucomicrobiota bacterium]
MDPNIVDRLYSLDRAFEHPVTLWGVAIVALLIVASSTLIVLLHKTGRIDKQQYEELVARMKSWAILAPIILIPLLLGSFWLILAVLLLSLLCYREYAKATGLFRHYCISFVVVLGMFLLTFAAVDHWYGFFVALPALGVVTIAAVSVLADRPDGYIQRTALGVFGFLLFGFCLAHIAFIAVDPDFRPYILLLIAAVELNDVFAYTSGKLFGKRKLMPHTSPNKTIGGALGALIATTALIGVVGPYVFAGTSMDSLPKIIGLGIIVSLAGQLGDLVLSAIKRDLGIKDMGVAIPGHGGILDRFDSLLLAAPAFFHYVGYFNGFGIEQPTRIFTG